ncbi:LysM peptidoglycan-binding domain-containing protein [Pseudoflavonifractor sp. 60]|uniref:LysM peptidoglycan-binding domain-containing protein n=1 Tax=Pseudoflavonifractor sp. 60 TaxID=2304576 RepID=UPI001368522E|nr:LysM peptidoglycan-binding domain-containing protein [Pseudoflavonifractor sp. 60]NBI65453.1 LysM peptidoglycan-binding domain-containing protein [Pseudoflavonifractor sp. 60]
MDIHVVQPGDTIYRLAQQYGVPMERLLQDNQLPDPSRLVVGQTIVVQYPELTHTVKSGDSLYSIAQMHGVTVSQLFRNNPVLQGRDLIYPGQVIVVRYQGEPRGGLTVNAYAYPYIDRSLFRSTLPYLSQLTPFTYRFDGDDLIPLQDEFLVNTALQSRVVPVFHLSNLDDQEQFSGELAHELLTDPEDQRDLIEEILETVDRRGYRWVDVDFEGVRPEDSTAYAQFLARLRQALTSRGLPLTAALVAKTSANQPGRLYEGIDYRLISQSVDFALLMTYDWGNLSGPPMAVAPLPQVRQVVQYALTEFSPNQLFLGIPNYGYDWTLPYRPGSRARSVSNVEAVQLAWNRRVSIRYDEQAQAPWFRYVDDQGAEHEVWFEDARSIQAKLNLAFDSNLYGVGYWNLDRPFPQNWVVLNSMAQIRSEM